MGSPYRAMIGHGLAIVFIGLLLGIGLLASLIGGLEPVPGNIVAFQLPGTPAAWARAHVGSLLNGVLIVVAALAAHHVGLAEKTRRRVTWMLLVTGYGNAIFYVAAIFAPNRALTFGDNRFGASNAAAVLGLLPALVAAVVALIAIGTLAWAALRSRA